MENSNHKPKIILQSTLIVLLASLAHNKSVSADSDPVLKSNTETNISINKVSLDFASEMSSQPEFKNEEDVANFSTSDLEQPHDDGSTTKPLLDQARDIHEGNNGTDVSEKLDGRGVVIASVDSGVDPNHQIFRIDDDAKNDLKITTSEEGRNDKIPHVFDFMSGDDSIMDPETEHGMHIAGILVGNAKDGFKGLAPNAQLLAYRTWSKDNTEGYQENNQFMAMEDAIKRGADVISLSIGELGTGREDDLWAQVIRNAKAKNVIIAASMANYGSSSMTNSFDTLVDEKFPQMDSSTTLSVSSNPYVIGVGSYYDTHVRLPHLQIGDLDVPYENVNWFNYDIFKQRDNSEISFDQDIIDLDEVSDKNNVKGKVVVVRRTADNIFPQLDELVRKQVTGIILINAPGTYTYGSYKTLPEVRSTQLYDGEELFKQSWAISLSEKDGEKLKEYFKNKETPQHLLHFKTKPIPTKIYDHRGISGFSTWGTSPTLELKPDLVAPGENVYSTGNENSYFNDSGTSMAAPHVAGASALLLPLTKSYLNTWNQYFRQKIDLAQLNKLLLQNTATILDDYTVPDGKPILAYSPRRQGAGAIDLEKATKTKVFISAEDNKGALNLKDFSEKEKSFNIVIRNLSDEKRRFAIDKGTVLGKILYDNKRRHYNDTLDIKTVHSRAIEGASLELASHVSVAPRSEMVIPVKLNVGNAALHEFVEGFIRFKALDEGQADLSIPYLGFYGDWNRERIVDPVSWQEGSKTKLSGVVEGYPLGEDKFDFVPWGVDYTKWKKDNHHLDSDSRYYVMQSQGGVASHAKMRIRPIFMRHAKDYSVEIVDATKSNTLKILKTGHYAPKFMESAFREYPDRYGLMFGDVDPDLEWNGRIYDSLENTHKFVKEGQYYIKIKARLDESRPWQETYIPFQVDNTKPGLILKSNEKENYTFEITDPHLKEVYLYQNDSKVKEITADSNGLYHVDVTGLDKKDLKLKAIDFADNEIIYDLVKGTILETETSGLSKIGNKKNLRRLASRQGFAFYSEHGDEKEMDWEDEEDVESKLGIKKDDVDSDDDIENDEDTDDEKEDPNHFESGSDIHDGKFTSGYVEGSSVTDLGTEDENTGQRYRTYYVHLQEGQHLVITNTNAFYNNKNQSNFTAPTWKGIFEYKAEDYAHKAHRQIDIPIYQGSNIINVKAYYQDKLIFNRGYAVKLDTEIPRLSFQNDNIHFEVENWADSEDYDDKVIGTITIPDEKLQLKGSIRDAQDGWKLFINEDMIDSNVRIGEYDDYFHQNQKEWFYEKSVVDGEFVKFEVWDHLKNTKTYLFKVKINPNVKVNSLSPTIKNAKEDVQNISLRQDLNVDGLFKGLDLNSIHSATELILALSSHAPDYGIQVLGFGGKEALLRIQKEDAYQVLTYFTEASPTPVDKMDIQYGKEWSSSIINGNTTPTVQSISTVSKFAHQRQSELPSTGETQSLLTTLGIWLFAASGLGIFLRGRKEDDSHMSK